MVKHEGGNYNYSERGEVLLDGPVLLAPDLLEWAQDWFKKIGMNLREMDPVAHDQHIAYVSHLSHISSYMLGKTVIDEEKNEKNIFDMAGSGFESTVRLAKSSPKMWTDILEDNKINIKEALDDYIYNLNNIRDLINDNKFDELELELKKINYIKNILNGINL